MAVYAHMREVYMKKEQDILKKWRGPLIISFVALLIISGVIWYMVLENNAKEIVVEIGSEEGGITMDADAGKAKGERWNSVLQVSSDKRDTIACVGETVKWNIVNNNNYGITGWNLKISPEDECYLNGFWGGSIEVHQFREGEEIVETLPGIVDSSKIKYLDNNKYAGVMMVRFLPGDYMVYYPDTEANADIIMPGENRLVVMNVYYSHPVDLSDTQFIFRNEIRMSDLWQTKFLLILWALWTVGMIFYHAAIFAKKRILHDTKNADQNISVMADLYIETYKIDLKKKNAYLINEKQDKTLIEFENDHLQESLDRYVEQDCYEIYAEDLKKFFDLSNLEQRMEETSTLVFEYKSKTIGWCSIRFFKLVSDKDGRQYVLAIQDINEERRKLQDYEEHIRQVENSTLIQGTFMDNVFYALNGMVQVVRSDMKTIEENLPEGEDKERAQAVHYNVEHLLLLGNFVYDLFSLESDRFEVKPEVYSLSEEVDTLVGMLKPFFKYNKAEFIMNIDKNIPDKLRGDRRRIMQILIVLLSSSMIMTKEGFVKLSIFGKQDGDTEELLISTRDTTEGLTEEQLADIYEMMNETGLKTNVDAAYVYFQIMNRILRKMGSELKIVSAVGSGSEFYFSVKQEIVNE